MTESVAQPAVPEPTATVVEHSVRTIDVKREYHIGQEVVKALRGVTISINRGEYISIMGPSGSGKSTLFNMIGGLDKPSEGKVYIDEVDIAQLDAYELAWMRCRKIGYIFQTFNLIPVMTALENVMLPMDFCDTWPSRERRDRALTLLDRLGVADQADKLPATMSGGQQQRVAVARALANAPQVLLADEPTGNLDSRTSDGLLALLAALVRDGQTVVMVTHEPSARQFASRTIALADGRVASVTAA